MPKTKAVLPQTTAPKFKQTPILPVEQGGCPRCGHPVYGDIGPRDWCPCEDCHVGGYLVPNQQVQQKVS